MHQIQYMRVFLNDTCVWNVLMLDDAHKY